MDRFGTLLENHVVCNFSIKYYSKRTWRRNNCIGRVRIGTQVTGNVFIIDITGPEHKGDTLLQGERYILRTDIVCELVTPKNMYIRKEYFDLTCKVSKLEEDGFQKNVDEIMASLSRISQIEQNYTNM